MVHFSFLFAAIWKYDKLEISNLKFAEKEVFINQ
jgi:hypothetical protein